MTKRQKHDVPVIYTVCIGVVASLCTSLLFSLIIPVLILNGTITLQTESFIAPVVMAISSLLGAAVSAALTKDSKLRVIAMVAGIYFVLLLCCALLFYDGISKNILTGFITVVAGSAIAFYLTAKRRISKKKRRGHRPR